MSSERIDPFNAMDVQLFAEELALMPSHQDVTELMCEEMAESIRTVAFGAVRRAVTELGVMKNRQYHHIPLSDARFEVLLNFDTLDKDGHPQRFRATTNEIRDVKGEIKSVQVEDFAVGVNALSVVRRQSSQLIKGAPSDLLDGMLPVIWRSNQGSITRYAGRGYSLEVAGPLSSMNFTSLTQPLTDARALYALMHQLSREVTLEEEYPY